MHCKHFRYKTCLKSLFDCHLFRVDFGKNLNHCNNKNVGTRFHAEKDIVLKIAIKIVTKIFYPVSMHFPCYLTTWFKTFTFLLTGCFFYLFIFVFCNSFHFPTAVDHTRVKLLDVDTTQIGAEYINANYIRQPSEADQCDMNSSSTENLSAALCAACTFAQQQKNCQNCQLLNKTCVQCAMKSAIIPLNGNCTNCGKKTEVCCTHHTQYEIHTIATICYGKQAQFKCVYCEKEET